MAQSPLHDESASGSLCVRMCETGESVPHFMLHERFPGIKSCADGFLEKLRNRSGLELC